MAKLKLIVDTNVWIKGKFFSSSNPYCSKIMKWIDNDEFTLVFAQDTIGELMYMLKQTSLWKYKGNRQTGIELLKKISEYFYDGLSVNTMETVAPTCADKNDDMFVKCAIEGLADYIISEDYASGMQNIQGIKAINSKDFVNIYHNEVQSRVPVLEELTI